MFIELNGRRFNMNKVLYYKLLYERGIKLYFENKICCVLYKSEEDRDIDFKRLDKMLLIKKDSCSYTRKDGWKECEFGEIEKP